MRAEAHGPAATQDGTLVEAGDDVGFADPGSFEEAGDEARARGTPREIVVQIPEHAPCVSVDLRRGAEREHRALNVVEREAVADALEAPVGPAGRPAGAEPYRDLVADVQAA
ncbi:MAG: hypothetical protein Q8K79_10150, partial [Solirubrobacteraceae bacterium]|nr:hypothetical protein [Solirubrobacteraceae bacterium]